MSDIRIEPQNFVMGSGGHGGNYPEVAPEIREMVLDRFTQGVGHFPNLLGLRLVEVRRGYVKLETENVKKLCQAAMIMHGGASFGMADTAVAFALMSLYGPDIYMLTVEMKITYLEPIPLGLVTAEAYILRGTRKSAYAEVDIWSQGKLAARANTTYVIRPMTKEKPPEAQSGATGSQ